MRKERLAAGSQMASEEGVSSRSDQGATGRGGRSRSDLDAEPGGRGAGRARGREDAELGGRGKHQAQGAGRSAATALPVLLAFLLLLIFELLGLWLPILLVLQKKGENRLLR